MPSPSCSPSPGSPTRTDSLSEPLRSNSLSANNPNPGISAYNGRADNTSTGKLVLFGCYCNLCPIPYDQCPFLWCLSPFFLIGELQYSPAVLQQRMTAELQYLESIQESLRQLGDMERLMGVSMAQQESASLAQMLKVKENIFWY